MHIWKKILNWLNYYMIKFCFKWNKAEGEDNALERSLGMGL